MPQPLLYGLLEAQLALGLRQAFLMAPWPHKLPHELNRFLLVMHSLDLYRRYVAESIHRMQCLLCQSAPTFEKQHRLLHQLRRRSKIKFSSAALLVQSGPERKYT